MFYHSAGLSTLIPREVSRDHGAGITPAMQQRTRQHLCLSRRRRAAGERCWTAGNAVPTLLTRARLIKRTWILAERGNIWGVCEGIADIACGARRLLTHGLHARLADDTYGHARVGRLDAQHLYRPSHLLAAKHIAA